MEKSTGKYIGSRFIGATLSLPLIGFNYVIVLGTIFALEFNYSSNCSAKRSATSASSNPATHAKPRKRQRALRRDDENKRV